MAHVHAAWFGSEMACRVCNPICSENHSFGKARGACEHPKRKWRKLIDA